MALSGAFCFVFVHDVSAVLFLFVVFGSVSDFPSVLVTLFRHQWGRVVSPPSQFGPHACVCVVHLSPLRCCHSPIYLVLLLAGFPVPEYSRVSHRPSLLGDPWYPPTCPLNTCCFALHCYCPQGLSLLPHCWAVLVGIVTVMFFP